MVKTYTDAAATREAAVRSLAAKVGQARIEAKGKRSEQLAATAKHLAALSQDPTLEGKIKFLADYAERVHESVKSAQQEAAAAEAASKQKIEGASKEAGDRIAIPKRK